MCSCVHCQYKNYFFDLPVKALQLSYTAGDCSQSTSVNAMSFNWKSFYCKSVINK